MSNFASTIEPHMVAKGIEGPQDLAGRMREMDNSVDDSELAAWMAGDTALMTAGDVCDISLILALDDEGTRRIWDAAMRDFRGPR